MVKKIHPGQAGKRNVGSEQLSLAWASTEMVWRGMGSTE